MKSEHRKTIDELVKMGLMSLGVVLLLKFLNIVGVDLIEGMAWSVMPWSLLQLTEYEGAVTNPYVVIWSSP
jgi:hypothetical protein